MLKAVTHIVSKYLNSALTFTHNIENKGFGKHFVSFSFNVFAVVANQQACKHNFLQARLLIKEKLHANPRVWKVCKMFRWHSETNWQSSRRVTQVSVLISYPILITRGEEWRQRSIKTTFCIMMHLYRARVLKTSRSIINALLQFTENGQPCKCWVQKCLRNRLYWRTCSTPTKSTCMIQVRSSKLEAKSAPRAAITTDTEINLSFYLLPKWFTGTDYLLWLAH